MTIPGTNADTDPVLLLGLVNEFTLCRDSFVLRLTNGTPPVDAARSNCFFIADFNGPAGVPERLGVVCIVGAADAVRPWLSFLRTGAGVGNWFEGSYGVDVVYDGNGAATP